MREERILPAPKKEDETRGKRRKGGIWKSHHAQTFPWRQSDEKKEKEKGGNAQKEPTKRQEKDFSILFLCDFFLNLT